jgi:hypothetical protein
MAKTQTVRARKHPGSNSLDITVPSKICTNYDIQPGDIFEVEAVLDRSEVKVAYKRVYRKR